MDLHPERESLRGPARLGDFPSRRRITFGTSGRMDSTRATRTAAPALLVPPAKRRAATPQPRTPGGSLMFVGWRWLVRGANERCARFYLPLPPKCPAIDLPPRVRRMIDQLHPITHSSPSLACWECHRIRDIHRVEHNAWNMLVAHLSGGMLYGREVSKKPESFTHNRSRQRAYKPQHDRPARGGRKCCGSFATVARSARSRRGCALASPRSAITSAACAIRKASPIATRFALKLGWTAPQPLNRDKRAPRSPGARRAHAAGRPQLQANDVRPRRRFRHDQPRDVEDLQVPRCQRPQGPGASWESSS